MIHRRLENASVGLPDRGLELQENSRRSGLVPIEEPLERIEGELLDRGHGNGARSFAGLVPAHAVGYQK